MVRKHIVNVLQISKWHSKQVQMQVMQRAYDINITREIADAVLQVIIPAGIDDPNTVVQVSL